MKKPACLLFMKMFYAIALMTLISSCKRTTDDQARQFFLTDDWQIQSSDSIKTTGDLISTEGFVPEKWYKTTVPATVLSVLVDNNVYPDPFLGMNLRSIPGTDYDLYRNF